MRSSSRVSQPSDALRHLGIHLRAPMASNRERNQNVAVREDSSSYHPAADDPLQTDFDPDQDPPRVEQRANLRVAPAPSSHGCAEPVTATARPQSLDTADGRMLLTAEETAALLRTTRKAVYAMAERAQLPGVTRIGRRLLVRRDDLFSCLTKDDSCSREVRGSDQGHHAKGKASGPLCRQRDRIPGKLAVPARGSSPLMSVPEAAEYLRTTVKGVYCQIARRALPVVRLGRRVLIRRVVLDRVLDEKSRDVATR